MRIENNEMKITYNVMTGAIRILSSKGQLEYRGMGDLRESREGRIKDLIVILKIVRKLESRQNTLTAARKKLIEAQLFHRQQ